MTATVFGQVTFTRLSEIEIGKTHESRTRTIETAQDIQQSGFTGPRRTEQDDELTGRDHEIDATQCMNHRGTLAISFRQRLDFE